MILFVWNQWDSVKSSISYISSNIYILVTIFILVTFDVVLLNLVRLSEVNYSDCFSHSLALNYGGLHLSFLNLAHLLINGETVSNPGSTQNDCKFPCGYLKKIEVFKWTTTKFDLSENSNVNVASYPKVETFFFNMIEPLSLNNIKLWPVTCPRTKVSPPKWNLK